MRVRKFRIEMFLVLVLMSVNYSCTKVEAEEGTPSLGEFEEVSIDRYDMLARGNCMPISLGNVTVISTIQGMEQRITDLAFLTTNEIACVTSSGKVFICQVDSGSVSQIADFGDSVYSWKLLPHNRSEMLLNTWVNHPDRGEEFYDFACMDKEGTVYWHNDNLILPSKIVYPGPIYDGDDYLFMDVDNNHNISLYRLDSSGDIEIAYANVAEGSGIYPFQYTDFIVWQGNFSGPYYIKKIENGYSPISLWNSGWDTGSKVWILDPRDRLIGFQRKYLPDGEAGSLIILEKDGSEPEIVDYDSDLGLDIFQTFAGWYSNWHCASDGETIVFTSTHYILRYSNNGLEIWHDNIEEYGDNSGTCITQHYTEEGSYTESEIRDVLQIKCFYVDRNCENFIMLLNKAILYGSDEINEIDFDHDITTDIQFTPDFSRACVGLGNGSIVVLDLETSNPEP
jgi:hypothetical protein